MQFSAYFRIFLTVAVGLMAANLLLTNDYTALLPEAEVASVLDVLRGEVRTLPKFLQALVYRVFGFTPFWWRMVSVLFLLGGIWFFYKIGQRVFGEGSVVIGMLVLGSSLLVPNLAKFATADTAFLTLSMMLATLTVLSLKQPARNWHWWYLLVLAAATATAPASAVLFSLVLPIGLLLAHPQRGQLNKGLFLGAPVVAGAIAWMLNGFSISFPDYQFVDLNLRTEYGGYAVAQVIGFLPWFGFLLAALWELIRQWRRGEELSIICGIWLLAGLASGSVAAQWVIAFLIGKNVINYFRDAYPLRGLVQTGAVLQVVAIFFIASYQMIDGFERLGGTGFRIFMGLTAAYWIPAMVGLSGLVGKNRRSAIAGTSMSGLLATLIFWVLLLPVIQGTDYNPRKVVAAARTLHEGNYFRLEIDPAVSDRSKAYLLGNFPDDPLQNQLPGTPDLSVFPYRRDSSEILLRYDPARVVRVEDVWLVR